MSLLAIDIETYSDVDLQKCGVYAYSDSPNFEILLFAYAFDEEETQIVDLACGEQLPQRVLDALEDEGIVKTAFNAAFERTCISKYLGHRLSPASWQCTAVQSAILALPLSLDGVGEVLNIQRKKLKEGVDLVRFFSMPCKPTKVNGGRTRNRPEDEPEKWVRFKTYCIRDVDAEREIRYKLRNFPIPAQEMKFYQMDQEINDRGILVDQKLAANEPSRLMYWPSTSSDGEFIFHEMEGELLDPDKILARYTDWHNSAEWPVSKRQQSIVQRDIKKQADPLAKPGTVGAFCRTYSIQDAIEKAIWSSMRNRR